MIFKRYTTAIIFSGILTIAIIGGLYSHKSAQTDIVDQPDSDAVYEDLSQWESNNPNSTNENLGNQQTDQSDFELMSLQVALSEAEIAYSEHLRQSLTFESEYQESLKEKGYDLEPGRQRIIAKREELQRAMTEGTYRTRDYQKIGRLGAELADLVSDQEKMTREIEEFTIAAREKFDREGEILEWEVQQAQNALDIYLR